MLTFFVVLFLLGCAKDTVVLSDYCLITKEIIVSKKDSISNETLGKILEHNETYDDLCRLHPEREL